MSKKVFVLGAGITGLSTGYRLAEKGYKVEVLEKQDFIGGMSTTFKYNKYRLDYGPHKIFSNMEDIMKQVKDLFNEDELLSIPKKSRIRLGKTYLSYPVGIKDIFSGLGLLTGVLSGISYLIAKVKVFFGKMKDASYEDWVVNRFGKKIYSIVFAPYAKKIWGEPRTLSKELAETRIAIPNLFEMIRQMIFKSRNPKVVMSADEFYYPKDGIIKLSEKMAQKITDNQGEIVFNKEVSRIEIANKKVKQISFSDGTTELVGDDDCVISTMPLHLAINCITPEVDEKLKLRANALKTRKLILVYIVVNRKSISNDNWLFFPEEEFIFNRVSEQKGFSPYMVPEDQTVMCCEVTTNEDDILWKEDWDKEKYLRVINDLVKADLIKPEDVVEYFSIKIDNAYPVYDLWYKENLERILEFADNIDNLFVVGRVGAYKYTGMLDCIDIGNKTANFIAQNEDKVSWKEYRKLFNNYIVID